MDWSRSKGSDEVRAGLLRRRQVLLDQRLDADAANAAIAQLLLLEADDPHAEIRIVVNSPAGELAAGLAVHDVIARSAAPIATVCVGEAGAAAALVLSSGTRGRRSISPSARVRLELGEVARAGHARDIQAWANEIEAVAFRFAAALAAACGRHVEEVEHDLHRGRSLDSAEAVGYGLVDEVLQDSTKRSST